MSKSGFQGVNLTPSLLLMYFFGVKETIAFSLLFFIIGDIYAVFHYRKVIHKSILFSFLPWSMVGVIISGIFGIFVSEKLFRFVIVYIIIYLLILTFIQEYRKKFNETYPNTNTTKNLFFISFFYGTFSGITSTLANFGGPVVAMYLLKRNILKYSIIGTGSVIFLSLNILKTGVFYFMWNSYTIKTVLLAISFWPWCIFGVILGRKISDVIPEKIYRWLLIILTSFACLILLLKEYL